MDRPQLNLPMSNLAADASYAADAFTFQILSSGQQADTILNAAQQFPQSVLLQVFAAAYYLFGQTKITTSQAKQHLAYAENYLTQAHLREKMWYQAVMAWSNLAYEQAINQLIAVVKQWPTDILAIKFVEWLNYCEGQVPTAKRMLALCQEHGQIHNNNSHFLAIHAFAHELNNELEQAYSLANKAIDLEPNTPWAHHVLAHYYLRSGQIEQGTIVLEKFKPSWQTIQFLLRGHNTWHLALHYLAERDSIKTFNLFNEIWNNSPDTVLEQIDAISLLWRMDMAGLTTQQQWPTIAAYTEQAAFEPYTLFNTLHQCYALVKGGKEQAAEQILKQIKQYGTEMHPQSCWQLIAIPALQGIIAFAKQDYRLAAHCLNPVIDRIFSGGGSDAQNELFIQSALLASLHSNDNFSAKQIWQQYLTHYDKTKLADYWSSISRFSV